MRHLVLYDGECPLCNRAVRVILKNDKKKKFLFTSLQGPKGQMLLKGSPFGKPPFDSLVLLENYGSSRQKMLTRSKASFRIAWHLGGTFFFVGLLSFLPTALFDLAYNWVAKRRYHLFSKTVEINPKDYQDRFI